MRRVAWLAAATLAFAVPPAHAAEPVPPCERLAVSTNYAHDHTAFCVSRMYDWMTWGVWTGGAESGSQVWMTYDSGRTWKPRSTFVTDDDERGFFDAVVGAWDVATGDTHRLYLAANSGLYVSTDNAATYHRLDSLAVPAYTAWGPWGFRPSQLTPFTGTFAPAGGPALAGTLFAYAGGLTPSAIVDAVREAHVPVAGTGPGTVAFLLPRDFGTSGSAVAIAANPVDGDLLGQVLTDAPPVEALYDCPQALACPQKLASFPANRAVDGVWLAPDFATSHRLWGSHRPADRTGSLGDLVVVESTDGGATLHPWAAVDALLASARAQKSRYLDVDVVPGPGNTLYLSLVTPTDGAGYPSIPQYQLFRSTDAGRTWSRRAYASYNRTGKGRRGNMPFGYGRRTADWGPPRSAFAVANDGTVFATAGGDSDEYETFWCSRDAGTQWARTCPK